MGAEDLDALKDLPVRELRERWREAGLKGEAPRFRHALVRGLAYAAQQPVASGVDAETGRLLKLAIRRAEIPTRSARVSKPKPPRRREAARLRTGTTLIRTWRGVEHRVKVIEEGTRFDYHGRVFTSLSEIARDITGARWSGPRFFGLHKTTGKL